MGQTEYLAILRHLLTIGGGILVAKGVASDGDIQTIIGAILAVAPVIWSIIQKKQQQAAVVNAAVTGQAVQARVTSPITPPKS